MRPPLSARLVVPWHRRLEARVAIALALLVAGAVGGVLGLTIRLVSTESRARAEAGLEGARTAFYSLLDSRATSAAALAQLVTELPVFRAHLTDARLSADRATISQMTDAYRFQLGAAFAIVTDDRGRWLASPGWPQAGTAPEAISAAVGSALLGETTRVIVERNGELFMVVTLPARLAEEVLGTVAMGFVLNDALAQELARLAQCEVVLVAGGRVAATSLRARAHSDVTALAAEALTAGTGSLPDLKRVGPYRYVGGAFPLRAESPALDVGRLVLLADWQPTQQLIDQLRERFLIGGVLVFGLALAGGLVFSRRVSRPLRDIASAASDIAGGNLALQLPEGGSAEEQTMARAFNEMSSSLRTAHDRLVHDAIHDPLTQLPNRILFMERLERAMARRVRHPGYRIAVLFIDLDRFKHVNDSLGHAVGDQLLVRFAERLATTVRRDDLVSRLAGDSAGQEGSTLARFGGDEFVVLLDDIREPIDAVRVAERIQEMASRPLQVGVQEIFACPSIGVTVSAADQESSAEVIRDADLAMHRAKAAGGNCYAVFDPHMHETAVERLRLETELRRAVERGELRLCYQPIVSLASREAVGFEALVRWQHPERGLLQPGAFLDVAEETGIVGQIDEWALGEACRQGAQWARARTGTSPLTMSVNLSARALGTDGLVARVSAVLAATGFPASALRLEVTEGVAVADPVRVRAVLQGLRALGARVSLDDFGTGYCSLSYLQQFPVDTLKIDRSFVARIGEANSGQAEIVRLIVSLGRTLGLEVVAEGTETAPQVEYLAALGCGFAQGYYFARPQPASEIMV